ncbi:MAG: hypothetical protein PHU72_02615 [Dethiosulfovibrio sp.]|nr:hypothetical protein [Dethiosulfovibrio sp.]
MKKVRSVITLTLALIVGLLVGARAFLPWEEIAELAFLKLSSRAPSSITLRSDEFFVRGLIPSPGVKDFEVKSFMGAVKIGSLSVTPVVVGSLTRLAPTVKVKMERSVATVGGGAISFDGEMILSLRSGRLSVEDIDITGGLVAKGYLDISLETSKIIKADMTLKGPNELDGVFSAASAMMPLKRGSDGVWSLKREEAK